MKELLQILNELNAEELEKKYGITQREKTLLEIDNKILLEQAEKEVEQLLKSILPNSPYANKLYSVGGYNRDEFLGLEPKDLDIVVELENGAELVTNYLYSIFPKTLSTPRQMGENYPIWQITFKDNVIHNGIEYKTKGAIIEFADTMTEYFPDSTTRQRVAKFGTLSQDVERRDFTVNMLMRDLTNGELKDIAGVSRADIENGVLRGHPEVSLDKIFTNDPLRMIRLFRFQAKYNWKIPLSVLKTVKRNAERIKIVSSERIVEELKKVMLYGKLWKVIKLMSITGLLQYILPEISEMKRIEQDSIHHQEGNVFKHTILVLKNSKPTLEAQLSALLHDVGKVSTQQIVANDIHFYGHEKVGEEIARGILYRLKFDKATIDKVATIVSNHMRVHKLADMSEKALRKFIRTVGDEMVDVVIDIGEADALGRLPPRISDADAYNRLRDKINAIRNSTIPILKKTTLNGDEIMTLFHMKPGPKIKEILNYITELEDYYAENGETLTKEKAAEEVMKKFKDN